MKFWVYAIDWRTMAIEIIREHGTKSEAEIAEAKYMAIMPKAELDDFVAFKTLNTTTVSNEMQVAVEEFKRLKGMVA